MFDKHDFEIEFFTIFYNDWLQRVQETWRENNNAIFIAKTINMHKISKSMFWDHIYNTISKIKTSQNM